MDVAKKKLGSVLAHRPGYHKPTPQKIRIDLRINLGNRPWWIYALAISIILAIAFLAYFVFFRDERRQMNYNLGLSNLSEGKFDEAAKNFEKASAGKNEVDALYKLAVSKYNQKDFEGALDAYSRALEKEPNSERIYNGLANLYRDQKNYTLAEEYYGKAVAANSAYVVAYSNWIIMLMDNGKTDEAKRINAQGLEKNPDNKELGNLKSMLERK